MNQYTLEELQVGQEEHFCVTITEKMLQQFEEITGDHNPLHKSEAFAMEQGYSGRVAYGMLTTSFFSTLAGEYLPGKNSLIHSVESKFIKPVFIGDTLTVSGTITEKNELFSLIKIKVVIYNQQNEKVVRGAMQIGILGKDGEETK